MLWDRPEVADLAPIAHLSAVKGRLPFVHFFDGFRTSHEVQKIDLMEYKDYAELLDMDAVKAFKERALSPNNPFFRELRRTLIYIFRAGRLQINFTMI